jgi:hypothetical protein
MSCSTAVAPLRVQPVRPVPADFPTRAGMVRRNPREGTMNHHQLIRIDNVIHLTTRELRELDAKLRDILDHDTSLTDRDIAIILASLTSIRAAFDLRHMVGLK